MLRRFHPMYSPCVDGTLPHSTVGEVPQDRSSLPRQQERTRIPLVVL